jgi:hypothetical protein
MIARNTTTACRLLINLRRFTPKWSAARTDRHICGGIQYQSNSGSLLPFYKETLIPEIKVLIFNGDVDACVPFNGNEWYVILFRSVDHMRFHRLSRSSQSCGLWGLYKWFL